MASSGPVWTNLWILNSAGSECYPYKVEVTGSIPVESTNIYNIMEKLKVTLNDGKEITVNKNQIAYYSVSDNIYTIVMSNGDVLVGNTTI